MNKFWAVLDRISLPILLLVAAPLALAPFGETPHLIAKLQMLLSGTLKASVDVFDLLLHGIPVILVILKIVRVSQRSSALD